MVKRCYTGSGPNERAGTAAGSGPEKEGTL